MRGGRRRKHRQAGGLYDEIVVDLFAGGGGASLGIERALGRAVDVAVNHDHDAVACHVANHPCTTRGYVDRGRAMGALARAAGPDGVIRAVAHLRATLKPDDAEAAAFWLCLHEPRKPVHHRGTEGTEEGPEKGRAA